MRDLSLLLRVYRDSFHTAVCGVSLGSFGRRFIREAVNIRLILEIHREPRRLSSLVRAEFPVLLFHDPQFVTNIDLF